MTKEEFLPRLSIKGQNIVEENLKLYARMKFQVFYSDVSYMESHSNSEYTIYVKKDVEEDIEYRFLHEFFHCVQYETGFPQLTAIDDKYKELATSISSLILDLNIRERLENNGYYQDIKYIKRSVKEVTKLLKMIQQFRDKTEMSSFEDFIDLAGIMLTSDFANVKNNELRVIIRKTRPVALRYYETFNTCIKLYSYSNVDGVNKIFQYLLNELELSSFMKIK